MTKDQFYSFAERAEYTILGGGIISDDVELVVYYVPQVDDSKYYVTGNKFNWELGWLWLPRARTIAKIEYPEEKEIELIEALIQRK